MRISRRMLRTYFATVPTYGKQQAEEAITRVLARLAAKGVNVKAVRKPEDSSEAAWSTEAPILDEREPSAADSLRANPLPEPSPANEKFIRARRPNQNPEPERAAEDGSLSGLFWNKTFGLDEDSATEGKRKRDGDN